MCNRYRPARAEIVEAQWQLKPPSPSTWKASIGPWGDGPFIRIRQAGQASPPLALDHEPELVIGTWALIGDSDKKPNNRPRMTNNARSETVATLRTYKGPWQRGQRCVIPAEAYDEPNWESGKNEWWSLRRADGHPWHLAGLWNAWTDPVTGEVFESYTMLTVNADAHPLLRRFHKPEPDLPPNEQDKRAVVPLEIKDLRTWLTGTEAQARLLLKLPPPAVFDAGPTQPIEALARRPLTEPAAERDLF